MADGVGYRIGKTFAVAACVLSVAPITANPTAAIKSGSAQAGKSLDFKTWRVGCDNVRRCRAYSFTSDEEIVKKTYTSYDVNLVIDRDGGPNSRAIFSFDQDAGHASAIEWNRGRNRLALKPVDHQVFTESDSAALVQALRSQSSLSLVNSKSQIMGHIALDGAAMLWMDDQQHRVGTVTALVKAGNLPASVVPVPPPLPIVHRAKASNKPAAMFDKSVTSRLVGRKNLCQTKDSGQVRFARLDINHTLAIVSLFCPTGINDEAGAYIITDGNERSPREAEFDAPADDMGWNWDEKDRTLGVGAHDHGPLADNEQDLFVWTGTKFAHIETRRISRGEELLTYRAVVAVDK